VAPNGTTVTTPQVTTPQALTTSQEANIQPPAGTGAVTYKVKQVTDPLAGNAEVTTAVSRLSTVAALTNPSAPSLTGGTNWSPGFTGPATTASVGGCSETESAGWSGIWTVTCSGAGPFNFATLDMSGASSVTFTGNNASAIYNFNGKVNTGSATVTFNGAGTYNILAGLNVGGGSTTKFTSPATFNIGPNSSCNGGNYSICNTGALLSFAGPSTFVLSNGLYNGGGETMVLGSGSTSNSYQIGSSSDGNAINMGGGSFVTLNDATGAGDVFTANGNISNGGGSCLALPAATQHDINGSIILGGGATLGGGIYTIYDYLALGSAGGGAVTCGGQSIGMKASGVSLIIGGNATLPCGSSSSYVFCITGGYTNVTLTAPSIGSTVNLAVVGPTVSGITAGAILTAGASGANITGAFYFPYGTFSMSGGASVGGGGCLELIAAQIAITQGTAVGSTCVGLAANPQKIVLVQ
jgi:hypothetical protein